eukprot:gnl/Chilomastix_caulleri/7091.p2 GENE.gnl/Chilomastix_caulleri/7091~~gnl/Chilomastix_caulleri/7091.p2  ORF type:complete len:74 (-),score=0.16 gnl/Chilomastix_caulleri/7091:71-292(-)
MVVLDILELDSILPEIEGLKIPAKFGFDATSFCLIGTRGLIFISESSLVEILLPPCLLLGCIFSSSKIVLLIN